MFSEDGRFGLMTDRAWDNDWRSYDASRPGSTSHPEMFWLFRVALSAVNHAQTSRRRRPLSEHCAPINLDAALRAKSRPLPPISARRNGARLSIRCNFHRLSFPIHVYYIYIYIQESFLFTLSLRKFFNEFDGSFFHLLLRYKDNFGRGSRDDREHRYSRKIRE